MSKAINNSQRKTFLLRSLHLREPDFLNSFTNVKKPRNFVTACFVKKTISRSFHENILCHLFFSRISGSHFSFCAWVTWLYTRDEAQKSLCCFLLLDVDRPISGKNRPFSVCPLCLALLCGHGQSKAAAKKKEGISGKIVVSQVKTYCTLGWFIWKLLCWKNAKLPDMNPLKALRKVAFSIPLWFCLDQAWKITQICPVCLTNWQADFGFGTVVFLLSPFSFCHSLSEPSPTLETASDNAKTNLLFPRRISLRSSDIRAWKLWIPKTWTAYLKLHQRERG